MYYILIAGALVALLALYKAAETIYRIRHNHHFEYRADQVITHE